MAVMSVQMISSSDRAKLRPFAHGLAGMRRKVDDPFVPKLIQTVRGMGYKLQAGHG